MKKSTEITAYDEDLKIEAYHFQGVLQPFPNHFHEHYVIGLMERGERQLSCREKEYTIRAGHMLLFHPGVSHACIQNGSKALYYRAVNISRDSMLAWAEEITGRQELPGFREQVIYDREAACYFRLLHEMLMSGSREFSKEEYLLLLLSRLIEKYGQAFEQAVPECPKEIEKVCRLIEAHFAEHLCLEQLCRCAGLIKSTLLRAFTKTKGVTPYRYLETVRVGEAKKLLEQGVTPVDAAIQTGFSDQSHFTNYFNRFIGLSPGVYRDMFTGKQETGGSKHEAGK